MSEVEFKKFAICDTCGAETLCREVGEDDQCGGCYWAPIHKAEHESQLAALREENAQLRSGMKGDYDLDAWLEWAATAKALREELAKYQDGFFQKVTDEDLKKISDFVGDGDLPTKSFFMRPDAANLANMTMHMVREVQSMRVRLADAERRNAIVLEILRSLRTNADPKLFSAGQLAQVNAALNPNPEAASHDE